MNEADAKHVVELYAAVRNIGELIADAEAAHTIKIEAFGKGIAESRRVSLQIVEHADAVREILLTELRALRQLHCEGLVERGFEVLELRP